MNRCICAEELVALRAATSSNFLTGRRLSLAPATHEQCIADLAFGGVSPVPYGVEHVEEAIANYTDAVAWLRALGFCFRVRDDGAIDADVHHTLDWAFRSTAMSSASASASASAASAASPYDPETAADDEHAKLYDADVDVNAATAHALLTWIACTPAWFARVHALACWPVGFRQREAQVVDAWGGVRLWPALLTLVPALSRALTPVQWLIVLATPSAPVSSSFVPSELRAIVTILAARSMLQNGDTIESFLPASEPQSMPQSVSQSMSHASASASASAAAAQSAAQSFLATSSESVHSYFMRVATLACPSSLSLRLDDATVAAVCAVPRAARALVRALDFSVFANAATSVRALLSHGSGSNAVTTHASNLAHELFVPASVELRERVVRNVASQVMRTAIDEYTRAGDKLMAAEATLEEKIAAAASFASAHGTARVPVAEHFTTEVHAATHQFTLASDRLETARAFEAEATAATRATHERFVRRTSAPAFAPPAFYGSKKCAFASVPASVPTLSTYGSTGGYKGKRAPSATVAVAPSSSPLFDDDDDDGSSAECELEMEREPSPLLLEPADPASSSTSGSPSGSISSSITTSRSLSSQVPLPPLRELKHAAPFWVALASSPTQASAQTPTHTQASAQIPTHKSKAVLVAAARPALVWRDSPVPFVRLPLSSHRAAASAAALSAEAEAHVAAMRYAGTKRNRN